MTEDKRARLAEINRDWGWWTPEARNGARVWMTVQLEAAWAEMELLREANGDLQKSAQYCPSCGQLLPSHAEWCGRSELVIAEFRTRAEAAEKRVAELEAEVERLKQEHDYEIIAIDDARKAAEKERDEHRGVAIACERRAIAAEADRDRLAQRVKVLEEALNSMVRVASRGHVPDDVFDAMARIRSAALAESPKQMEEAEK